MTAGVRWLAMCWLLVAGIGPAVATEIYKCTGRDGRIAYSSTPCPSGTQGKTIEEASKPASEWRCIGRERLTLKPLSAPNLPAEQAEALDKLMQRERIEGLRGEIYRAADGVLHRCYAAEPSFEARIMVDGLVRLKRGEQIEEIPYVANRIGLLQRCTKALLTCRDNPDLPRPVGSCFNRVGYCQTETPEREAGTCCPRVCADRFRGYLLSGMNDSEAFFATFHGNDRCIDTGEPLLP